MQILKADSYKSVTISHLLHSCPNSVCIIYDNCCPHFMQNVVWIDSKEHSLEDLKEYINEEINTLMERKDYLIIYTNKTEEWLKELIDFINSKRAIVFREVLVTCRL